MKGATAGGINMQAQLSGCGLANCREHVGLLMSSQCTAQEHALLHAGEGSEAYSCTHKAAIRR